MENWFAVPLAAYLLILIGLVVSMFAMITPEAVRTAFSDPALRHSIALSLITSSVSSLLSMALAIPAGYVMSRRRFPGHLVADTILDLPIVLPPLVMGLCILIFFNTGIGRWLDRGLVPQGLFVYQPLGIVLTQVIVGCAFSIRVVKAGFDAFDRRLEDTAMTLGADSRQTFLRVVLPNMKANLVAAAVITWARIFGLFGPILLVCGTMRGRTEIMPTTIFLETSIGRIEVALVVAGLMIVISTALLIAVKRLNTREAPW
jgi:molybdate transport system permease protein